MDAAATWDLVAPALAAEGWRVIVPDLRGFGEAPRAPPGAYYHFADYVFDVADLVRKLVPADAPLVIAGHSMGGTVATLYAGAFPERVARLALIEGAGPPSDEPDVAPARMRQWIEGVRAVRARGVRSMPSHDDALRRLRRHHPRVSEAVLRTRLASLANSYADGSVRWRADPLHDTRSPAPFQAATWKAFARKVTCPVLFVSGGPTGWHPLDEDDRLASFARLERAELADAGHMMHWTTPEGLAEVLSRFWSAAPSD